MVACARCATVSAPRRLLHRQTHLIIGLGLLCRLTEVLSWPERTGPSIASARRCRHKGWSGLTRPYWQPCRRVPGNAVVSVGILWGAACGRGVCGDSAGTRTSAEAAVLPDVGELPSGRAVAPAARLAACPVSKLSSTGNRPGPCTTRSRSSALSYPSATAAFPASATKRSARWSPSRNSTSPDCTARRSPCVASTLICSWLGRGYAPFVPGVSGVCWRRPM